MSGWIWLAIRRRSGAEIAARWFKVFFPILFIESVLVAWGQGLDRWLCAAALLGFAFGLQVPTIARLGRRWRGARA